MENKEDDIEDLFRKRFENDETPVSPRVWQNIKNTLPEDKKSFGFTFSPNVILWSILGILMVCAVIGSYLHFTPNNSLAEAHYGSQQANPSLHSKKVGEKSTRVLTTADSSSLVATNQDAILKSSHHNNQDLHSKTFSSDNYAKRNHDASVSSVPSYNSNNTSLRKKTKTKIRKSISTDDENHTVNLHQKGKIAVSDNLNVPVVKKRQAQKTSDTLHENKRLLYNGKDKAKKDKNESIQSSIFLTDSDKSTNKSNLAKNEFSSSVIDSVKTESKLQQITDKNNINLQTDTTQLAPADTSMSNVKYSVFSHTVLTNHSVSQDSINKKNATIIAKNTAKIESLDSISTVDHKNVLATDSTSTPIKKETLSENVAFYSSVATDSSSVNQENSSTRYANEDALSEIKMPLLFAQDSVLMQLDSLQSTQPDSVLAHPTDKKEKGKSKLLSRLSFDLVATALLTGVSTSTNSTDSSYQIAVEDKNKNDKNSLGYAAGVMVNYKVSERISASVGFAYTNFSEHYHFNYTLKKTEWVLIDSNWQTIQVDSINRDSKVKDQYNFLSIPLHLSYNFLQKGKLKLAATVGLRSNILIKGVTYIANAQKNDVTKVTSGFNKISFMYQLSLAAEYKCNERLALLIQPIFLYGANSIHNKASSLQQKPYGAGVTIGLRVTF